MAIAVRGQNEIQLLRAAGRIAGEALEKVRAFAKPGVSTKELDKIAEDYILTKNAKPAFLGYNGYPASLCVSINEEIVHGIPSDTRKLKNGDVVSLDVGVYKNGYYGDTAITIIVGLPIDAIAVKLVEVTRKALYEAIKYAVAGRNLFDISFAIQTIAETAGFSPVREYTGHGIGRRLHEEPYVLNYVPDIQLRKRGPILKSGNVLAIEPMLNVGTFETEVLADKWTVVTRDRKLSAHFEHTVVVNQGVAEILTEV